MTGTIDLVREREQWANVQFDQPLRDEYGNITSNTADIVNFDEMEVIESMDIHPHWRMTREQYIKALEDAGLHAHLASEKFLNYGEESCAAREPSGCIFEEEIRDAFNRANHPR
jgi:hypothetical protein